MNRILSVALVSVAIAAAGSAVSQANPRAVASAHVPQGDFAEVTSLTLASPAATQAEEPLAPAFVLEHENLLARLSANAPGLDTRVLDMALQARTCAAAYGDIEGDSRLAVIDYSLPSTQKRMWVFDIASGDVLFHEHVAHGQGSGGNMTTSFSNQDGSHQTSLGLFRTAETYVGGNGYSMRMDGLDAGFNDNARDRLIVMHGADYVNPAAAPSMGRLGRSWGCPAVRTAVARDMIDLLKDGQLLFSYYPKDEWIDNSRFLNCDRVDAIAAFRARGQDDTRVASTGDTSVNETSGGGATLHTAAR
ncbi:MAG TPA: murein L,D-transpeptidase catalytic domain family protein [Xanthomonadaceae bacterium]|nr:murein L,D-transpeptidase catalytic domain family protein [Xanthomonadaceae bacterium]